MHICISPALVNTCTAILFCHDRKAWIKLGDIKKDEAQRRLVVLLHSVAPNLKEYVLEQWTKRRLEVENEEKMYVFKKKL